MKKFCLLFFLSFFLLIGNNYSQVPQAIPYQAVARDNSDNLIINQSVSLRFSVRDLSATGTILYRETQSVITNPNGLFTTNIGEGTVVTGTFSSINWGVGEKYLQIEMDVTGGTSYTDMGAQQILSVPYALYSGNGGVGGSGTINFIPKFYPDTSTLGNSMIYDNGTSIGIGTSNPHPSAILHVKSTSQGFLMPVMCTDQRLAIVNPAPGLMVFDSCENTMYYYSANINVGPWIPITINIGAGNTLDEAYDEGGPGAGRIITADMGAVEINTQGTNSALDISNTNANGIDIEITGNGKGIKLDAQSGTGAEINMHDNGDGVKVMTDLQKTGDGIDITMNGTGHGIDAQGFGDEANNVINSKIHSLITGGNWYDGNGRAGFFQIENVDNNRPSLEARTKGTGHGIVGITSAFTSTNEVIPVSGVAGFSFVSNSRNGVSGFSAGNRGIWGKTVVDAGWKAGPVTMRSGVYGTASSSADLSIVADTLVGTIGYTPKGVGVLGVSAGFGYGVIGISKTTGAGLSEAGVWGNVQTTTWDALTTEYPFAEAGAFGKGPLGVLAQSKSTIALWAESQEKIGIVTTMGSKKGIAALPFPKSALIALSDQPDAINTYIKNDGFPALPALKIVSTTSKGPDPGAYVVDIMGTGSGGGINLITTDPTSTMATLNVSTANNGIAAKFHKSNLTSALPPTLVSTNGGLGKAGEFEIGDNDANMVEALTAKTKGRGPAAAFIIEDALNASPCINISNAGLGTAGKFFVSNAASTTSALNTETVAGNIASFKSNLATSADVGVGIYHAGVGTSLKIENTHAMASPPLLASSTALVVESKLGPVAVFDNKSTVPATGSTPAAVQISSVSPGQVGLKVTTAGTMLADPKAAEFVGDVDITKKLTVGGTIELGSGSSATIIEDDKISVGELKAGSISLYGTPILTVFGSMHVAGTLTKAGGTFKIDHPLDPENKYLYHSFVESPDMMNIYNGNVVTDEKGFSTVELPSYFESLNIDFRYQLTVIGTFANAIIAKKVEGNKFVIQTDKPGIEVSWQVTGIRNDIWAKENRVVPEVEKEEAYKGSLLYEPKITGDR